MATIKRERFMGIKQKKFVVKDVVKELTGNQRVIYNIIKSSVVEDVVVKPIMVISNQQRLLRPPFNSRADVAPAERL